MFFPGSGSQPSEVQKSVSQPFRSKAQRLIHIQQAISTMNSSSASFSPSTLRCQAQAQCYPEVPALSSLKLPRGVEAAAGHWPWDWRDHGRQQPADDRGGSRPAACRNWDPSASQRGHYSQAPCNKSFSAFTQNQSARARQTAGHHLLPEPEHRQQLRCVLPAQRRASPTARQHRRIPAFARILPSR